MCLFASHFQEFVMPTTGGHIVCVPPILGEFGIPINCPDVMWGGSYRKDASSMTCPP